MKISRFKVRPFIYITPYEGEGGEGGEAGGEGSGSSESGSNERTATYTKEQFDTAMAEQRRKANEEKQSVVSKLEKLQKSSKASAEEKEQLQSQIDSLKNSMLTEKERADLEIQTQNEKFETQIGQLTKERDTWKNQFQSSTIKRSLTDAAVKHKAINPNQIVSMFGGSAVLDEVIDDEGNGTGQFVSKLKFVGIDPKDKKTEKEMILPVAEALEKIKKDGLNDNLFQSEKESGTGASPTSGSNDKKVADPSQPPLGEDYSDEASWREAYNLYRQNRKKQKTTFTSR